MNSIFERNSRLLLLGAVLATLVLSHCSAMAVEMQLETFPPASAQLEAKVLQEIPKDQAANFSGGNGRNSALCNSLADYSICFDKNGKRVGVPFDINDDGDYGKASYYPVTRVGGKRYVAIIQTVANWPNCLDPFYGFDYGPIPAVKDLTSEVADALWGQPIKAEFLTRDKQRRIYKLQSTNIRNEKKYFTISCVFYRQKLWQYKIAGPGVDTKYDADMMWNVNCFD